MNNLIRLRRDRDGVGLINNSALGNSGVFWFDKRALCYSPNFDGPIQARQCLEMRPQINGNRSLLQANAMVVLTIWW